jgi:hypothetical protein
MILAAAVMIAAAEQRDVAKKKMKGVAFNNVALFQQKRKECNSKDSCLRRK